MLRGSDLLLEVVVQIGKRERYQLTNAWED